MFTIKKFIHNGSIHMYTAQTVSVHADDSVSVLGYGNEFVMHPNNFEKVVIENANGKTTDVVQGKVRTSEVSEGTT